MSTNLGLLRVLILEDDEDIVDLIKSILDKNYEFISAANGLEGLQMAEEGEPDLVICDVMMPVMDGWEFIRTLREKPGFEKTPVIFLSALSAQDQIRKGYALGAALYLTKPIDPGRLKRNIELFIDDHGIVARPKRKRVGQVRAGSVEDFLKFAEPKPAGPAWLQGVPKVAPRAQAPAPEPVQARPPMPAPAGPTYSRPATPQPAVQAREGGSMPAPAGPAAPEREGTEVRKRILPAEIRRMVRQERVRVMVVEDDPDTCGMLLDVLKERYEVVEANDGMVAIERAVKYKPDVFIIDGMLPRMTGHQLTMILKKNREFYKAPIIFISAKATPRDQEYARSLGISHFLAKPFAMPQLLEMVEEVASRPDFAIRTDREPLPESSVPQNFSHYEQHRKTTETPTLAEMEKDALEARLKQQLK